jgi:hypothetical protein
MKEAVLQEVAGKCLQECYQQQYGRWKNYSIVEGSVNYNPA